jgi:hypothetical protein
MRTWKDQPTYLDLADAVLTFSNDGRIIELRKWGGGLAGPPVYFVSVGNLFASQTLEVPDLETGVRLVNHVVHSKTVTFEELQKRFNVKEPDEGR